MLIFILYFCKLYVCMCVCVYTIVFIFSITDVGANKTILQIMRSKWPRSLLTYQDIVDSNLKWITDVITEFNKSELF